MAENVRQIDPVKLRRLLERRRQLVTVRPPARIAFETAREIAFDPEGRARIERRAEISRGLNR